MLPMIFVYFSPFVGRIDVNKIWKNWTNIYPLLSLLMGLGHPNVAHW